jgi:integrase
MASIKRKEDKSGKPFYEIRVRRGRDLPTASMRWRPPAGWSKRTTERELAKVAAEFELKCSSGEALTRVEKRKAEEAAAKEAAKLRTVREYTTAVFLPTKALTLAETSRSNYATFLNRHILPVLGDTLLADVSPAMIQKLLLDFQKAGYANSSSRTLYVILRELFEAAFLDESIPTNPMLRVRRPATGKAEYSTSEEEKAYTAEQLAHILACAEQEPLMWRTFIALTADAGLRRGEACGLQWADVDFKTGTITVERNIQYTAEAGTYITTPKSGKTRRVDVGPEVLSLFRQLRADQASRALSPWIFTADASTEPLRPRSATSYFKKFGRKYGIEDFHPHKLRHTAASIALTSGADIVSISARLGHADTAITLRMYAHANEESIRRAGQVARDALKKARQG